MVLYHRPRSASVRTHSFLAAIQSWFQLAIIDGVGSRFDIHNQSMGGVGNELYVVAGNGAPLTVSHHMSLGAGGRGSGYVVTAIVFLALLQALHFTNAASRRLTVAPLRGASQRIDVWLLSLPRWPVHSSFVLALAPVPISFDLFLASKRVAAFLDPNDRTLPRLRARDCRRRE